MKTYITLIIALIISTASGCRSANMGTGIHDEQPEAFASTRVTNSTLTQLDQAILKTFQENGFRHLSTNGSKYKFSKAGDKATAILYGTTWSTDFLTIEPELIVQNEGNGNFLLTCEVMVIEHVESEHITGNRHQLIRRGSKGYQKLLEEIKVKAEN